MTLRETLLEKGKLPLLGAFLGLPVPVLVESLGRAGYDFLILDGEHGDFAPPMLEACLQAADLVNLPTIVRVAALNAWQIQAALDAAATGVQIPAVETAKQAEEAISASHFPPRGRRGFGSTTRAADYGFLSRQQIIAKAEAETIVILQVETRRGVENLDAILAVAGLDIIFVGTSDLSLEYGFSSPSSPEMGKLLQEIIKRANAAGKVCGVHIVDCTAIAPLIEMGVRYFTVSAQVIVNRALKDLHASFRREIGG